MSFNEKFHNLSSKGKEEQLLESSDEEDSEREVQADFEFFDPKATNFHGVKILLQNYLDDKEWDQTTVGTVVKVADDEDEALFALDSKCFRELKEFLLEVCPEKNIASDLELLLEKKGKRCCGLLVSQRVMNLPPQLLPPLDDGLLDEVSWATEDEFSYEIRGSLRFKSYILVTKIYKLKNPKQKIPRRGEEDNEETIFLKLEDEIFLELSSWSFTFLVHSQLVTSQESLVLMVILAAEEAVGSSDGRGGIQDS
ncbi:unnamed protein product [Arabis nemorensis]|uniref:Protein BCCIP homolog n=1 Tax=Arabis nemorensis TaxID=586526 RepID=A0A565CHG9_9BRAS|nr:unnamed protein product [Arabis nemorensis]